jgi:hypothetical protein
MTYLSNSEFLERNLLKIRLNEILSKESMRNIARLDSRDHISLSEISDLRAVVLLLNAVRKDKSIAENKSTFSLLPALTDAENKEVIILISRLGLLNHRMYPLLDVLERYPDHNFNVSEYQDIDAVISTLGQISDIYGA